MKKTNILLTLFLWMLAVPSFAQLENVVVHADQMPYFSGCKKMKNGSEKKRNCSNELLVAFLADHVQYPDSAKVADVEGTVYVSFIIDEAGKVTNPAIIRDIGYGCGKAAIEVLKKMPDWEPGKHEGKKVKVKLNLPIHFYLKSGIPNPTESDDYKITWGTMKGKRVSVKDLKNNLGKIIMVRDRFGDPVPYEELTFSYKRKKQFASATSHGTLDKKLKRIVKKAKSGGLFYVEVLVHDGNKKIKVGREFELVE
ncbi:MAG: energy transducer TonB [Bacteroidota bacterium]